MVNRPASRPRCSKSQQSARDPPLPLRKMNPKHLGDFAEADLMHEPDRIQTDRDFVERLVNAVTGNVHSSRQNV